MNLQGENVPPACDFVAMEEGANVDDSHKDEAGPVTARSTEPRKVTSTHSDTKSEIVLPPSTVSIGTDHFIAEHTTYAEKVDALLATHHSSTAKKVTIGDPFKPNQIDSANNTPRVPNANEEIPAKLDTSEQTGVSYPSWSQPTTPQAASKRQLTTDPAVADALIATAKQHGSSRARRAGNKMDSGPSWACVGVVIYTVFTGLVNLLRFLVLISPVVYWIIGVCFWWQFAAARGEAKNLECDLDIERFFRFATFMKALGTLGTLARPVRTKVEAGPCSLFIAILLLFLEFFFGMNAVVWIPNDATCPEIAPDLFYAAKQYLVCQAYIFAVSLVIGIFCDWMF